MTMDPDDRRIRDEVEHHLDELRARLEAEGMSAEAARSEARRRFGDPDAVGRETRAVGGHDGPGLGSGAWGDLRQVVRGLRRAPTFTGAIGLTLALALGAAIAVSGVVWDVLLRPLDLRDPASLVSLTERMPESGIEASPTSEGTFHDWRRELESVRDLAAWEWVSRTFEDPERPEELTAVQVTGNMMPTLGIVPALGRALAPDDETVGAPPTAVVISQRFWARRFGSDPEVVGRSIPIEGVQREIVGVLPARVEVIGGEADLWVPSAHRPQDATNRGGRFLHVVGRLAPGASVEVASAEIAALTARIAETYPTSARGWTARAVPLETHLLGDVRLRLVVAAAAVGLLLLVATVNVANLLLVRSADSKRELAVRAALGAGRGRIARMKLLEGAVLGLFGGAAGLAFAWTLQSQLATASGVELPRALGHGLPSGVVGFGLALALAVGLAVGVWPAIRGAETAVGSLGRGMAGGSGGPPARSRNALVVVQIAVTMVLLVGAGLLVRTVSALRAVDPGFDPTTAVAARVIVDGNRYPTRGDVRAYQQRVLEQTRALPGVRAAGLTSALPMDPVAINFDLPTRSDAATPWDEAPQVDFRIVSPGLMEALGFRRVEGRFFDDREAGGPLTAIVNRSLAEAFWPGESAVGKEIQNVWREDTFAEVVGVVEDTRFYGPAQASRPELFLPDAHVSMGFGFMTLVADGTGDAPSLQAALERAILEADPRMPAQEVFPVASLVDATVSTERFYALLLSGFAILALALAAAGIYGVLAYAVRLRTREMGVRLALGATRRELTTHVLGTGLRLGALGVLLGLVAAVPATRLVSGMLFGVQAMDPATLGAVALLLVAVAALACLLPALRAGRLQPTTVLRDE